MPRAWGGGAEKERANQRVSPLQNGDPRAIFRGPCRDNVKERGEAPKKAPTRKEEKATLKMASPKESLLRKMWIEKSGVSRRTAEGKKYSGKEMEMVLK